MLGVRETNLRGAGLQEGGHDRHQLAEGGSLQGVCVPRLPHDGVTVQYIR